MTSHRSTKVASRAILEAIEFRQFKAPRIRRHLDDPPSRQTITRILRQLEAEGWLERDVDHSSIWRAGPIIRSLDREKDIPCDVTPDIEQSAKEHVNEALD